MPSHNSPLNHPSLPAVSWFRAKRTESAESGAAGNFFTSFKPQKAAPPTGEPDEPLVSEGE